MNDEHWYKSSGMIAFLVAWVVLFTIAVLAPGVVAQEASLPIDDGGVDIQPDPVPVEPVGFFDSLGIWWDSFGEWLGFGEGKGEVPIESKPDTIEPLLVGWNNRNHTVVTPYEQECVVDQYVDAKNGSIMNVLGPCQYWREDTIIDDQWQVATTRGVSVALPRDRYWKVVDSKVVGISKKACDGWLPNPNDMQIKDGCEYVIMDVTLDEQREPLILADVQQKEELAADATIIPDDAAYSMARTPLTMRITEATE